VITTAVPAAPPTSRCADLRFVPIDNLLLPPQILRFVPIDSLLLLLLPPLVRPAFFGGVFSTLWRGKDIVFLRSLLQGRSRC